MSGSKIIDFHYQFRSKDLTSTLTVPVTIPNPQPASDLVGRLVNAHNLPCYVEEGKKRKIFSKKCWEKWASTTCHVMKRKVNDNQMLQKSLHYLPCLIKWWSNAWKVFEFFSENVWIYNLPCYKEEGKIWLIGNEISEKCSINILIKE